MAGAVEVAEEVHEQKDGSKQAAQEQHQVPPGAVPITVKVAEDSKPGQTVWFTAPNGQQVQTVVPEDKKPGDEFTVLLPALPSSKAKLKVPEGAKPGERIVFEGPTGKNVEAVVPEGKAPGDEFYVELLPDAPVRSQQEPRSYVLKVPEDKKTGEAVYFVAANGQQMRAIVPEGKQPGDSFEVHVSPPQLSITVPDGKQEGEEVDFEGPGGVLMKAVIPKGKKAGEQFTVSLMRDPDLDTGLPALCTAAAHGDLEAAQKLVKESNVDVNGKFEHGFTPLFYAATSGEAEVAKWLLEQKADVSATNSSKRTALHWAARNGHGKVVELLLAAKAEINGEDGTGRSPLALALGYKHPEAAEMLRAAGAVEPGIEPRGQPTSATEASGGYAKEPVMTK
eukprot:CAMPEP_0197657106 /NCGR_PEP_ID=MMETSP1338-20131121/44424_1 /TAXON_ID=43686 ORGANISM="Pelagodinium beii, Strain RCC1491" /NCGR_SAMPLE_ID=MMETSP1338 /ASSEMBLY_ACC=CAM_ASM_000754 /LENGTH=393 /DNA_ID=CAMNT_0043233409 /DNA_START=38 /DNA_END=1219 /DNA_ORIENTATION=-